MINDQEINDTMPTTASGETCRRDLRIHGDVERIERARADVAEHDALHASAAGPHERALPSPGTASIFAVALIEGGLRRMTA